MVVARSSSKQRQARRPGMASVEVVMATAIGFTIAGLLLKLGMQACNGLFQVIGTLVGWPYM